MRVLNRRWRGGSVITHNGAPLLGAAAQQEPHHTSTSKKCIPHRIPHNSVDATWCAALVSQQRLVTTHSQPLLSAAFVGGSVSSTAAVPDVDAVVKARLDNIAELVFPWLGRGVAEKSVPVLSRQHEDRFTGTDYKLFQVSQLHLVGYCVSNPVSSPWKSPARGLYVTSIHWIPSSNDAGAPVGNKMRGLSVFSSGEGIEYSVFDQSLVLRTPPNVLFLGWGSLWSAFP